LKKLITPLLVTLFLLGTGFCGLPHGYECCKWGSTISCVCDSLGIDKSKVKTTIKKHGYKGKVYDTPDTISTIRINENKSIKFWNNKLYNLHIWFGSYGVYGNELKGIYDELVTKYGAPTNRIIVNRYPAMGGFEIIVYYYLWEDDVTQIIFDLEYDTYHGSKINLLASTSRILDYYSKELYIKYENKQAKAIEADEEYRKQLRYQKHKSKVY